MADKKAVGGGCLTHTLYVWPDREVIADSVYWPLAWHLAFDKAARQLGERVACCVLGGLPICPEPISIELLPSGWLEFSVHVSGTSIDVVIWTFEGPDGPEPDAPGPNGGVRRSTADGLVLGLRGTGKSFSITTFYDGPVPRIPVGHVVEVRVLALRPCARNAGTGEGEQRRRATRLPALGKTTSWVTTTGPRAVPPQPMASYATHHPAASPFEASGTFLRTENPRPEMRRSNLVWLARIKSRERLLSRFDNLNSERCDPEQSFKLSVPVDGRTTIVDQLGPGEMPSPGATRPLLN